MGNETAAAAAFENVQMDIKYRRQHTEDSLRREAASLILDLERMVEALDGDLHINSMGVVQSAGQKIDMLCAQREAQINEAKKLDWLQEKVS